MHMESIALRSKPVISMTLSPVPSTPLSFLLLHVVFHLQASMNPTILFIRVFSWIARSTGENEHDKLRQGA